MFLPNHINLIKMNPPVKGASSKYIVIKLLILLVIVVFVLTSSVSAVSFWVDPAVKTCPTTGHPVAPSLSCAGETEICGSFGCFDVDTFVAPGLSRGADTGSHQFYAKDVTIYAIKVG